MKIRMNAIRALLGAGFLAVFFMVSCTGPEPETEVEDTGETGDCQLKPMYWLSDGNTPEPNYQTFPCGYTVDESGDVTNRAFHEISWQYFLWLTEEVTIGKEKMLRFESMYSDEAINMKADNKDARKHILGGIQQAGSNGVLVDENGRAVYTSMMIDDIYHKFVRENKLYDAEILKNFPADTDFANGSMSMKASWKIIPEGQEPPKGAYTRKYWIYDVVDINGELTTSDNYSDPKLRTMREETVALVGFHIAVVVKDHPEFIWATFEHNDNAPNYILKNQTKGTGVPTDQDYTFYAKNTPLGKCNVGNLKAIQVDPKTQVITGAYGVDARTQVYRRFQYGGGSSTNQDNIEELNDQVHNTIDKNSIWQNYSEVGAVWFDIDKGHLTPDWSLTVNPDLQTGSETLSNSTIETFTQDPNQQNSCFSCHNTMKLSIDGAEINGKNVLTSHILLKNYFNSVLKGEIDVTIDRQE